jgi:hypothetical protein
MDVRNQADNYRQRRTERRLGAGYLRIHLSLSVMSSRWRDRY